MGMPMSEAHATPAANPHALAHAGEVAHWAVMLLGWLWLGEQGMRLGWSVASGVSAVALWWAVRIVCRGSHWTRQSSPLRMGLFGWLTALGLWMPVSIQETAHAHAALLAVAVVWGVWSALIESRSQTSTFRLSPLAWHPLLAAALVAVVWQLSEQAVAAPLGQSCLLIGCAAVLYRRERFSATRAARCKASAAMGPQLLAPSAMGLMMGALWLGDTWCAGLGWTTAQMVWAHLGLMAGLPAVVAWGLRMLPHGPTLSAQRAPIGLGLMALGALMLLGNTAVHGLLAMLLPSLAWALHCSRHRITTAEPRTGRALWPARGLRGLSLLLGPGLLLAVGAASPNLGPVAMQAALATLGGLAALWLGFSTCLPHVARKSTPATSLP